MTITRQYGVRLSRSTRLELERHADAPRRQPWRSWAEQQAAEGSIAVDLFAGAGGLSHGLEAAGYKVVLSVDHDPMAIETHLSNFPGPCLDLDLAEPDRLENLLELLAGLDVDLIAGGPPCQPFSRAGRSKIRDLVDRGVREALDPRRELWRAFLRVAEEVRPRAVLMENVPDMALGDDMRTVRYMAERLERLGYETDLRIIEAWRYGVPQHRQRLMFVALRDGVFEWPKEVEPQSVRDAIGDLPRLAGTMGGRDLRYRGPKTEFQIRAREGMPDEFAGRVFDHMTRAVRDDDLEAFKLMRSGTRYSDLPEELKRYRDDIFDDKYNRLAWNDYSRSITAHIAKDGYWYIHPQEHRTLTVREAARIQTFPDVFRFAGTRSDAFRLIGNAVPPLLGQHMGTALLEAQERTRPKGEVQPSERRRAVREILKVEQKHESAAYLAVGDPWRVLIGMYCGRRRDDLALAILGRAPTPAALTSRVATTLMSQHRADRETRVIHELLDLAKIVRAGGWGELLDKSSVKLAPTTRIWVEAVGLGVKHVAVNAGNVRVAGRILGDPEVRGVAGRMLLAQLIGHSEDSAAITAALAGLADRVCTSSKAKCGQCPLAQLCLSAGSPAVTG